jgi:hypothetical protein
MSSFKSSIVLLFFFSCAAFAFQDNECLVSVYSTSVSHKTWPMGLMQEKLTIEKNRCVITVVLQKHRFWKTQWLIDVCREPVHIKYGTGSLEIFKRRIVCETPIDFLEAEENRSKADPFCSHWYDLEGFIQDNGLIFAQGEKEDLSSDHGKMYCAYLLLKRYLKDGVIFSNQFLYQNFLMEVQAGKHPEPKVEAMPQPVATATPSPTPTP